MTDQTPDASLPTENDPTPSEIRQIAREIRSEWSDLTRHARRADAIKADETDAADGVRILSANLWTRSGVNVVRDAETKGVRVENA